VMILQKFSESRRLRSPAISRHHKRLQVIVTIAIADFMYEQNGKSYFLLKSFC